MPLTTGTRLGPYEILSPLGEGGMGEVYRARDPRLQRDVAIKVLPPALAADPDRRRRFEQEARAVAALNHPHICQIYDVGPTYLVLEYIDGEPLRGPVPAAEAVRVALQIARALEAAHERGILHRDLKPANIIVHRASGTAKLLDFGLAKLVADEADVTRTLDGIVVGTAAYMSPEQAEGGPVDVRSDVFAFGAVLFELLAGHRAFAGTTPLQVLDEVRRAALQPLTAPPALDRIVRRCLARRPEDRFQDVTAVRRALEEAAPALEPARAAQVQPSIAVLPFANMSGDKEQEYFSDGLAEEIINALVSVPGLKVIARTSAFAFKGQNTDVRRIAETLGVTNILEGSVRRAGTRIRVTAQLVAAADGTHLWSQRFDRDLEDVFAVQDDIARAVASALRVTLGAARPAHVPTPDAHEALLKGRHHLFKLTPESQARSLEYLEKAVELDPGYAAAHAWLSEYFFGLVSGAAVVRPPDDAEAFARRAALRAVDLDPSCREAHAVLSGMAAEFDHDWVEAERRFVLATHGDAVPAEARRMCGFNYLLAAGRSWDAVGELELALRDDPLNTFIVMNLGVCLHAAGDAERAFACFSQALELDERNWLARANQGFWLLERGQMEDAARAFQLAQAVVPGSGLVMSWLAAIRTLTGDDAGARELLRGVESRSHYEVGPALFSYYNLVHDFEKAAECGAQAIAQRSGAITFIAQFAFCRGLRASPYWPRLARLMNLPVAASG